MLDKRLVLVSGKGGAGKSAVAAGLALLGQRRGLRVLAIAMEPAGGLATHFGTNELTFTPREVRPGLHAMRMVRSEALLEYLSIQLRLPGMGRFGAVARAFDALATAAPAVREIVTIGKILWEVKEERWDVVVVDAPPTGQISSYLQAPVTISELVTTGRISGEAEWMAGTLADPDATAMVLVTLPEELPTAETRETIDWVKRSGVVPDPTVIANRVLAPVTEEGATGIVGDMVALHRSLWAEQQVWLTKLPPDLSLPYLFGLFTPGEVAAHMSDELEALA
ncbi:MAG TPA: ArsA family ATPase [Acidimicrobiia bacterium]|jgi:anion-transporting  ArsA/GET3 family ATPase|nr:ArsA family ATPase [Acidimicrobiia bacterium]